MQKKTKPFKLSDIADATGSSLKGDPDCQVYRISPIKSAQPRDITFMASRLHLADLKKTQASAVILQTKYLDDCPTNALIHENPLLAYAKLVHFLLESYPSKPFIHPTVVIGKDCHIHPTVTIKPYCIIENNVSIDEGTVIHSNCVINSGVKIGSHGTFFPNVVIYDDVKIGKRAIVHSGAVIGSDGFGNAQNDDGTWVKIPQIGSVVIGDDVEIGTNTTIDRGAIEDTVIGNGVKLDNQIQVGHNVHIGNHTAIAACTGIAGSAHIGDHCMIGGAVNILGHIKIADKTIIAGASNVGKTLDEPGFYLSAFNALPHLKWKKNLLRFEQLDELIKRLLKMEKTLCEK